VLSSGSRFGQIWSIRNKVLSIAVIAMIGFIAFLAFSFQQSNDNSTRIATIKLQYTPQLEWARLNVLELENFARILEMAVATGDEDLLKRAGKSTDAVQDRLQKILENQAALADQVHGMRTLWDDYAQYSVGFSSRLIAGSVKMSELKAIQQEAQARKVKLQTTLNDFLQQRSALYNAELDATMEAQHLSLMVGLSTGLLMAAAMFITAFWIANNVSRSVRRVRDSLSEMARGKGDLTQRISLRGADEIADLTREFNLFLGTLNALVGKVVSANRVMSESIHEMNDAVHITNVGAKKQHEKTIEVVSSVENMIKTSGKVLNNTESASAFACSTKALTVDSMAQVKEMMVAIDKLAQHVNESAQVIRELGKSAQTISSVSNEISRIAEQTDLLALNAAIEAARAGELGRGFAVVADEVRNLANRTNSCTANIRASVGDLQRNSALAAEKMDVSNLTAKETVTRAARASDALDTILGAVQEISTINSDVASAAQLQNQLAETINRAMEEITLITVQTADTADRTDEKSRELEQHASDIQQLLQSFKVNETERLEQSVARNKVRQLNEPLRADSNRIELF